jgi:uncharacterized protein (UPF0210 family)
MKIRSITYFANPGFPLDAGVLNKAGEFITAARPAYVEAGYEVQTARLAIPPFPTLLPSIEPLQVIRYARELEEQAKDQGYDYVSLGPALPDQLDSYTLIPDALEATQDVFFSGLMTTQNGGVSLPAVHACAEVIYRAAPLTPDGFANLRFAALANVPPGAPFFPAAYHNGQEAAFALATEAADLAVRAFSLASSLQDARRALILELERHASEMTGVAHSLAERTNLLFGGIDFTLAPFPQAALSLGTAIEQLGVPAVGLHGSLAAAAILADTLDQANFPRAGFSGLMLPVMDDSTLAERAADGSLTVTDLLMYSAVCGTGLDTVPLPGDTSIDELSAVLLDLAALAQRLDKPLTARLMPIPGKSEGEPTGFDFAYFANSRILGLRSKTLGGQLSGDETFFLHPR